MATDLVIADRVKQLITATAGTGNQTLAAAVAGYRAFSAIIADGVPFPYAIKHQTLSEWEEGIGETSGSGATLIRRVLASSNADALVNFSPGTKEVALVRHSFIVGNTCWCGTGEDGALLITGSTPGSDITLTEDAHYTTVAWQAGATARIITNGFILHVSDHLDKTNCPAGGIVTTGLGWGTVGGGMRGGLGADSDIGVSGHLLTYAPAVGGRLGGAGASGGGASGNGSGGTQIRKVPHHHTITGVPGGGGGGGGYAPTGFQNGGRGGGVIEIRARRVTRTTGGTATAAVQADGDDGVAGTAGGGGGGGGRIRLIYGTLLGTAKTALFRVAGGVGGGGGGGNGGSGSVELIDMRTGAHTLTTAAAVDL